MYLKVDLIVLQSQVLFTLTDNAFRALVPLFKKPHCYSQKIDKLKQSLTASAG
jgi:hypothetical protein